MGKFQFRNRLGSSSGTGTVEQGKGLEPVGTGTVEPTKVRNRFGTGTVEPIDAWNRFGTGTVEPAKVWNRFRTGSGTDSKDTPLMMGEKREVSKKIGVVRIKERKLRRVKDIFLPLPSKGVWLAV